MLGLRHFCALPIAILLLAGCAQLLPKSSAEVSSQWHSFEQARDTIEAIVPGKTTVAELRAMGIDPYSSPNVQLLTYSDIALRFPLVVGHDHLDVGLRQCLEAGKACTGYYINVREMKRDRTGGFWRDTLGFTRVTDVSGWSFNSLLLLVNDRVVYTLYGGQPNLREQEISHNPLGPIQGFGESLPLGDLLR